LFNVANVVDVAVEMNIWAPSKPSKIGNHAIENRPSTSKSKGEGIASGSTFALFGFLAEKIR
jgi:hypothetical protein